VAVEVGRGVLVGIGVAVGVMDGVKVGVNVADAVGVRVKMTSRQAGQESAALNALPVWSYAS
jgi:hypothetical protein